MFVVACSCYGVIAVTSHAASTNQASRTVPFAGVGEPKAAVWTLVPSLDGRSLRFSIECSGVSAVSVEGGYSLRISGQAASAKPGTPDVPHLSRLLPGVKGARAILTIYGVDPTNLMDVAVAPAEGFRLDESEGSVRALRPYRQFDPVVFGKDQFWPPALGSLEEGAIGTQKVVRVECYPIEYNPVRRAVRFYRRLEGELRFEPK